MEHPVKPALLVVRRVYYDQFAGGAKTIEHRRHRPPFTARVFYVGRVVRIAYNYQIARYPTLLARVTSFDVVPAREHPELIELYPDLLDDDELALITLRIDPV